MKYILSIDQGTTSSRAILFNIKGEIVKIAQKNLKRYFPNPGYVEHIAEDIITGTFEVIKEILNEYKNTDIISCGITNQRETIIAWDKKTGKAIYNAINWQDRRTDNWCKSKEKEYNKKLKSKTGLLLDAYFSASKINWILNNVPQSQDLLQQDRLACGTVDSFLLWHLTKGKSHLTDATNASRTLLYNIKENKWDEDLLNFFEVPLNILPEVKNCCDEFGVIEKELFGKEIPINAIIGDQQSATVGQCCFQPFTGKITFGTGCFIMLNIGEQIIESKSNLLTTILYRINNKTIYALEGSCFYAGAVIQWLKDDLGLINNVKETEIMAKKARNIEGLYFVPAFDGLGAPYWNSKATGIIKGITNRVGKNEIVKAALDAIILQSYDLIKAMESDTAEFSAIRVDGGMVNNDWFTDRLATILKKDIEIPENVESTAFGAAILSGYAIGAFNFDQIPKLHKIKKRKSPKSINNHNQIIQDWHKAIEVSSNN